MKKTIATLIYMIIFCAHLLALPAYKLTAKNFTNLSPNVITFELHLQNKGPENLRYWGGQYMLNINRNYSNGGTLLLYRDSSIFPFVQTETRGDSMLLIAVVSSGFQIDKDVLLVRLRMSTESSNFTGSMNLQWRDSTHGIPYTKVDAIINNVITEITNHKNHYIEGNLTYVQNFSSIPAEYYLAQNYPNPFNPKTIINYQLPVYDFVSLKVYDIQGEEVAALVNKRQDAGYYNIEFNAGNFTSGIYFYQLKTGNYLSTKKLIIIK